jgi:hypothetical protein
MEIHLSGHRDMFKLNHHEKHVKQKIGCSDFFLSYLAGCKESSRHAFIACERPPTTYQVSNFRAECNALSQIPVFLALTALVIPNIFGAHKG